jgi:lipopolysaccharide export system permease protein
MTLLDRAIARQFLTNVVVLFVILCGFVVIIDVSLNADQFLLLAERIANADLPEGQDAGGLRKGVIALVLCADLWWPKLLQLYNFLLGMVMVASMGFTCTQMLRHREFIAMMAAGIGLHRVMRPIMIVALGLTSLQIVNQELIIPRIAPLLVRDHQDAGNHKLGEASVSLTPDGQGRLFRAGAFDADTGEITGVFILERDADGRALRAIVADTARYENGAWVFENGYEEPRERASMGSRRPIDRIESSLDPDELRMDRFESYKQALSFSQVGNMLDRESLADPDQRSRLERIRWGRFSMMISSLLALLIAMPFYIQRVPTNMVVQSLKCAPFAILAVIGGILGASVPIPGLPAAIGAFVPVMILSIVAVAQFSGLKT